MPPQVAERGRRGTSDSPIRVLLADGHDLVRGGIRALLEAEPGIVVAGEARGAQECVELADAARPDVVVMETILEDGSGVDAARRILEAHPQARVLVLTSFPDERAMIDSVTAGASGFLLKHAQAKDIVRAVRTVASGGSLVDPAVAGSVLERLRGGNRHRTRGHLAALSAQEERILHLLGDGLTSRKIGDELHLAESTVRNYVSSIFAKLGVRNRAEGVALLARHVRAGGTSAGV